MVIDVLKDYESAREVIASALDESVFSRRGVAKLLNVPASTLSHNISGLHGKIQLGDIVMIAKLLDIKVSVTLEIE